MQEIIELSDSNEYSSDDKNVNKNTKYSNNSIEIIDLSMAEHVDHTGQDQSKNVIMPEIIEDSEVYLSTPTNSHVKPHGINKASLDFDNNNSIEISAPLIHDDITTSNTAPSGDITIRSELVSTQTSQRKESHRGLLDNIIDNDLSSDKSLNDTSGINRTFDCRTTAFDWSPKHLTNECVEARNIGGPTSISPPKEYTSPPTNTFQSSPSHIIESPPSHNTKPPSDRIDSLTYTLDSQSQMMGSQRNIIESEKPISSKPFPPPESSIRNKPVNQSDQEDNRSLIPGPGCYAKKSNKISNRCIIKPYVSSSSKRDCDEDENKTTNKKVRVRKIVSGGKLLTEDVELDLPMFLDESGSDFDLDGSSPLKKKQKRSKTAHAIRSIITDDIILPLARSKTIEGTRNLQNEHTIDECSNLKVEYARLSKYIINAKSFTDEESKQMIKASLQTNKEAFKKANQICKDNQKMREQIIIELPNSLMKILENTQHDYKSLLEPATIQVSYDEDLPMIRFLRRVDSVYDFNHDYYYPCDNKIMEENEVLLYYDAKTFFQQYAKDKRSLYKSIGQLTKRNKYVILILYDLKKLEKTLELIEDNRYKERVTERLSGSQSASPSKNGSKSRKTNILEVADLDMKVFDIEQRIRFIDREWKIKIHTVHSHLEFLHSLPNLVTLIAKKRMDAALRFMKYAHINVKSGTDKTDILKKMLHEIGRIPELKTRGISKQYPDLQQLYQDFSTGELQSGLDGRHLMSEKMERRLHKLFTSCDPNEVIE